MTDPTQLGDVPAPPGASYRIERLPRPDLSEEFYREVGRDWHWVDRLAWSDDQWRAWVDRPEHHLLVCELNGVDAGYAELEQQPGGNVEIAYFGILAWSTGRGLGKWWLATVIEEAWRLPGTARVWVHTCSLDSPAALPNYLARGLRQCASSVEWREP